MTTATKAEEKEEEDPVVTWMRCCASCLAVTPPSEERRVFWKCKNCGDIDIAAQRRHFASELNPATKYADTVEMIYKLAKRGIEGRLELYPFEEHDSARVVLQGLVLFYDKPPLPLSGISASPGLTRALDAVKERLTKINTTATVRAEVNAAVGQIENGDIVVNLITSEWFGRCHKVADQNRTGVRRSTVCRSATELSEPNALFVIGQERRGRSLGVQQICYELVH